MLEKVFDWITRGSIRFKWITLFFTIVVLVAGIFAVTQLKQELIPAIEFPQTVVLALNPGSEPDLMLEDVTKPIEDAVSEIEGVVNVESTTSNGVSVLIVRSEFGLDQEDIRAEIESAVESLDYPEGMDTPELLTFSFADLPVASFSVSSDELSLEELKNLVESEINPQLEMIVGVAAVDVSGGQVLPTEAVAVVEPKTETSQEPTPEPTAIPAEEPTPTLEPTATPVEVEDEVLVGENLTPAALPDSWVQAAAAQGQTLETTDDLTPELIEGIITFAPDLLVDLTPEMLFVMPLESLISLPDEYISSLDPDTQAALGQRLVIDTCVEDPAPLPLPDSWVQAAAAQGQELATTADLTSEIILGVSNLAPQLLDELTDDIVLAMPLVALEALPDAFIGGFDPEIQEQLSERLEAIPCVELLQTLPLPDSWVQAAAAQGQLLEETADLTPEVIEGISTFAPQLLADLTPEMLMAMPGDALAALPPDFIDTLDPEVAAMLNARLETETGLEEIAEEVNPLELPPAWQAAGDTQGIKLVMPEDVTPEILKGITEFAPQLLEMLTSEQLKAFSPEILGWLPSDFIVSLEPELLTELDELASDVGGVGALALAAQVESEALVEGAPELSGAWTQPPPDDAAASMMPTFETAADLMTTGFAASAAELLNLLVQQAGELAPDLIGDLTIEVIAWLIENEESFLENLDPATLRLLSPEVLTELPEDFYASLDEDLAQELKGIASGTVEVFVPTSTINRVNGNPSLNLSVYQDKEANTVAVSHEVFNRLDEFEEKYPGLHFDIIFEQASFIEESISGVTREGILGAVFAVIVILFFLSGVVSGHYKLAWRSTLVIAVSIPLSIFMTFALMKWFPPLINPLFDPLVDATHGIPVLGAVLRGMQNLFPIGLTLNIMTLSGITVAIGRVVDDSIVVLENIYRHIQRGEDRKHSVLVGTKDVSMAIFASTLTTVVVFLPIGLLGGLIGEFFLPFGIAVTYALASSFFVAITVVPLLAFLFIRKEHLPEEKETKLQRGYTPVLKWALSHRFWTLTIAVVLLAGSALLLTTLPQAFLPEFGEPRVSVAVDLNGDVAMADTDALVAEFEKAVQDLDGIKTVSSEIGSSGGIASAFLGNSIDQGQAGIQISVDSVEDVDALVGEVRVVAENIFGKELVTVSSGTLSSSAFGGFALVASGDPEELAAFNEQAIETLNAVDGLANSSSNLADESTYLRVDRQPAVRYTGELETRDTIGVTQAAKEALLAVPPPEGVVISEGFESQQQTEGFSQAILAIGISIIVVYFVLVGTFRSFVHPFTILFSLPLAVIGAAFSLWLADSIVGLSALVGMMMLVGIVVTNAIVLIDRVQNDRSKRGMGIYEALVEGGRTRLRPILMTAIAAILALVPLAVGLNEGAIIASDLAIVVIGGLTTSTLLTLVVVPVMYSLLDRFDRRNRKIDQKNNSMSVQPMGDHVDMDESETLKDVEGYAVRVDGSAETDPTSLKIDREELPETSDAKEESGLDGNENEDIEIEA